MIRKSEVINKATCDACGKDLNREGQEHPDGTSGAVHYGLLQSHFGYGSRLDHDERLERSQHLCEECYTRAMRTLGFPVDYWDISPNLKFEVRTRPLHLDDPEGRKGIYHTPVWTCKFCDFRVANETYVIPPHECAKFNLARMDAAKGCTLCCNANEELDPLPRFGYRCHRHDDPDPTPEGYHTQQWLHFGKSHTAHTHEQACAANEVFNRYMIKEEVPKPEEPKA